MKTETGRLAEIWVKNIDRSAAKERAEKILRQIKRYHREARSVLELGVGLGAVLYHFKKFEKYGLDLGEAYVKVAKKVIPDAKFFVQNMVNFKINKKFDIIFTTNECINEVQPYANWEKTFRNVYGHLNDGGLFILEMPTEHYLDWHKNNCVELEEKPSGYLWDKTHVEGNKLTWDTIYFKKLKNGLYEVEKDKYYEFIHSAIKVKKSLEKNFKILKTIYFNNHENVIIVCRKLK